MAGIKREYREHQVVEVGMVRKVICVKQGDLIGGESRSGVRVSIVVMKACNGSGAKGHRKVDT